MINQDLLKKIALILNRGQGIYIEAGANDGITYSNTKLLEYEMGWSGILIEPSIVAFKKLILNRPNNININCALVAFSYLKNEIKGNFNNGSLMSKVSSKFNFHHFVPFILRKILSKINHLEVNVNAQTLQSILDKNNIIEVDFFSLDVEGYEVEVLEGLNLSILKPKAILVEVRFEMLYNLCEILLKNGYQLMYNMSNFNMIDDKQWDGTHQDYLFIRSDYVSSVNLLLQSQKFK
jgi:FkbM family methyltransferase